MDMGMETIKPSIHSERPSVPSEEISFKAGDKVFSRNPNNDIIEDGWEVLGVDPVEGVIHLQKDSPEGGVMTRTQSESKLREINRMIRTKRSPENSISSVKPETPEELDALSDLIQ